ncbi:hypothetical protein C8R45DRAFT_946195 [Mycena sanguinolenta]|nr:hypothetical protein C8R45DRAFT_946195 [Mycena sanguinolenta]
MWTTESFCLARVQPINAWSVTQVLLLQGLTNSMSWSFLLPWSPISQDWDLDLHDILGSFKNCPKDNGSRDSDPLHCVLRMAPPVFCAIDTLPDWAAIKIGLPEKLVYIIFNGGMNWNKGHAGDIRSFAFIVVLEMAADTQYFTAKDSNFCMHKTTSEGKQHVVCLASSRFTFRTRTEKNWGFKTTPITLHTVQRHFFSGMASWNGFEILVSCVRWEAECQTNGAYPHKRDE